MHSNFLITLYYSENLRAVRAIVNNWIGESLLISRAKDLVPYLVRNNQYQTLATNVKY